MSSSFVIFDIMIRVSLIIMGSIFESFNKSEFLWIFCQILSTKQLLTLSPPKRPFSPEKKKKKKKGFGGNFITTLVFMLTEKNFK